MRKNTDYDYESARRVIKERLSEKRYEHSLAVAKAAEKLARKYNADPAKARFTGLLHDICKDDSEQSQLQMFDKFGIILTESELQCPKLWHAILGAEFIRRNFTGDQDIINSVRYHTTGRQKMSLLEKVIYVADCISSDRHYDHVEELRELAKKSLEDVIFEMSGYIITNLVEERSPLHKDTVDVYNEIFFQKTGGVYG